MIITCSNCETKFNLPDSKIPAGGVKVKCSKCANVFKVSPPALEPEDEVASMLEEEIVSEPKPQPKPKPKPKPEPEPEPEPEAPAEEDLDEDLFGEDSSEETEEDLDEDLFGDLGADDEAPAVAGTDDLEDDLFGSDDNDADADLGADLFDDDEPAAATADDEEAFDIDEELFGSDEDDEFSEEAAEEEAPEPAAEEESFDEDELFGDDEETESFSEDELFGDDEEVEDEESYEEGESFEEEDDEEHGLPLDDGEINGFDLDEDSTRSSAGKNGGKKKGKGMIITLIIVLLFAGGAGAAWYLKLWESVPFDIPFVSSTDNGEMDASEPPSKRFSKFSFKDLRQFYVNNDKAGQLFIIEGKVVNNFNKPKELIEVEAQLFDDKGQVLDSQRLLCGNTLSLFQLEVQSREEIDAGLTSKVGVLSNNTLLKPGMDTPFMVVFFKPSPAVKEYVINVVEAKNPPKK
ncbi:MJ0042 family finger-like domain-containing protein [Maridesulfovibrio ferrireducens]|uniref:MJ0042 family finger-like domain-containing protein n=1 Tax=Maridesulfovibrio ferrireducens TaxID=246191 RepID=A0A1G9CJJ3_9BACT|nr:DUF3426 domain-containing protein [Maridesulfovibrio ferrireducens]SDK51867.1 MJ0042 family finger-like domain-containing protein [Maridesulfovibrio ferrireducens]